MKTHKLVSILAMAASVCLVSSCGDGDDAGKIRVAFVTNNPSDFWTYARAGCRQAEKDFNVVVEFKMPAGDDKAAEQKRICEDLVSKGVEGIAISPNDAENQIEMINKIAESVHVICHDSDAPRTKRVAYVGSNNVKAGQEAGKLIKEVLPDGGKIWLFVGQLDAQNARERIQGIKEAIAGTNIEIVDTRTDNTDRGKAKSNVEDVIAANDDIGCLVGLWSYNGPAIVGAVKGAGKAGQIPIVTFDEEADTLQGVADGHIHATVVQQPYKFGYESIRVLAALVRGQDAKIPDDKIVDVPVRIIRKDDVKAFREELARYKQAE